MKRIIALHHWLGTFFFVLFTTWFLSGFVMMYKGFPSLSGGEALQLKAETNYRNGKTVNPPQIIFNDLLEDTIQTLRAFSVANRMAYQLNASNGTSFIRYADNGKPVMVTADTAQMIGEIALGYSCKAKVKTLKEVDQWIPRPKFTRHLPVFKVVFEDDASTWVHVSSVTGEVLNMTTSNDRFWAWVGAIPHWIYFRDIRIYSSVWQQLILWLSGIGLVMTISGIVTGIVR